MKNKFVGGLVPTLSAAQAAYPVVRARRACMALARTVLVAAALGGASLANAESLLVPAYIYPSGSGGDAWTTLAATAQKVATTVILNPSSGPGSAQDANYVAAIAQIHAAGGKVIGYVSSAYATRSLSAVVQDISTYLSFYSVDGFFIDEMTSDSDTTHIQYYQSVYNYIKGLSSAYAVTGNPGTGIPSCMRACLWRISSSCSRTAPRNTPAMRRKHGRRATRRAGSPISCMARPPGGGCCRLSRARRPWGPAVCTSRPRACRTRTRYCPNTGARKPRPPPRIDAGPCRPVRAGRPAGMSPG